MMKTIQLKTSAGISHIYTGESISNLPQYIKGRKVAIIADENIIKFYGEYFPSKTVIKVLQGEDSKHIDNASRIYEELLTANVDRTWFILGMGGGVTTDLAGFVASTYLRGLPFGFVSTSLLGQVDASIGGKNGVNLEGYKNIIGVIRQPEFVICDINTLKTLSPREFVMGWAEIIKCAAIMEKDLFDYLERFIEKGLELNEEVLDTVVYESAKSKAKVVEEDEFESGIRKLLNFGHTFAHGLEKLYKLPHGEAVSIGMVLACGVSVNLGLLSQQDADRVVTLLKRAGLAVSFKFDPLQLVLAMEKDKKRVGDKIQLILLEGIGKALIYPVPINQLNSFLNDLPQHR
jgi:3-dehydroquinate synthase